MLFLALATAAVIIVGVYATTQQQATTAKPPVDLNRWHLETEPAAILVCRREWRYTKYGGAAAVEKYVRSVVGTYNYDPDDTDSLGEAMIRAEARLNMLLQAERLVSEANSMNQRLLNT